MIIYNLTPGGYASNCYVVVSEDQSQSILIDPSMPPERFLEVCPHVPMPTMVLLTHAHFDHIYALSEWYARGASVTLCTKEVVALDDPRRNCSAFVGNIITFSGDVTRVDEGDIISLGKEQLMVMETPGHTEGSCCYYSEGILFSGDTLFADGSVGRTDLPSGSYQALRQSLRRLLDLPPNTKVYPGHNQPTTIKNERKAHLYE